MKRFLSLAAIICITIAFSSCSKTPDHAKYIPKDATAVLGVDMGAIGKKIAWNVILGSEVFDKMSERAGKDTFMKDLENAGIDFSNTFYIYAKGDERFSGGQRVTALIPIDDAGKWENYVKKIFPGSDIKSVDKRKEVMLAEDMYAGWSSDLLIIMNTINTSEIVRAQLPQGQVEADATTPVPESGDTIVAAAPEEDLRLTQKPDMAQLAAEMSNAFNMKKENSIMENKHFMSMEKDGHDITAFVNYESIMSQYSKDMAGMMGGLSLSGSLWKDAAFASGYDFKKGAITGDMKYYISDELKEIGYELTKDNADKEMIERLPAQNLNVLTAMHLAPKGLKAMLEKFGVLGFVNLALAEQNLSSDDIFEAFTGDIAFTINDFTITKEKDLFSGMEDEADTVTRYDYKPDMNWLFVMKIGKQEKFNKLLQFAVKSQVLRSTGPNSYTLGTGDAGTTISIDKGYMVAAKTVQAAAAYLNGSNKGQKLPEVAQKNVYGHPSALYFDVQQMLKNIGPDMIDDADGAAKYAELKTLLNNAVFYGGEFKNNAFTYQMSVNFVNQDENALLLLLDMASRMSGTKNLALR